jgi:DNA repair exonuclease SbcCD nuclease subunit
MRFIHTSDWQIGKSFGFADDAAQALRDERLEAITRLGQIAWERDARCVLVAGDVYDVQTPSEKTLRQPIERMRAFPDVEWHLIPGNHDPHTPRGPWERLRGLQDAPANIQLHLTPDPAPILGGAAFLLPGVLTRQHAMSDPTEPMDHAATPDGATRIGLAHGSLIGFGSDPASTHNRIAYDRPARAGLAYLAMGDFHGAQSHGERAWYSGTPETDDFGTGGAGGGDVLVVDADGPRAVPRVARERIGRFAWHRLDATLYNTSDLDVLETRLRELAPQAPGTALVWLTVSGALSLPELDVFEDRIVHGVGSALRVLRLDRAELRPRVSESDLNAIDHAGFVRTAADRLAAVAADDADPAHEIAAAAMQRLYVMSRGGRR